MDRELMVNDGQEVGVSQVQRPFLPISEGQ